MSGFYVTGGTLRHDAPSYVERQADKDLLDGLLKGEFCYVLTSRQMGKSSLMVRTANKLREQGIQVAVLDLTAIGQNLTPEQWYDGLVLRMGRQLRMEDELDDFWEANRQLGPCQRFFTALREVALAKCSVSSNQSSVSSNQSSVGQSGGAAPLNTDNWKLNTGRLVIFIDELDVVRSLPFSTDEFFAAIRECYTRRTEDAEFNRLTFCLLGVATPSDLIRDARLTPFNIGRRIELNDFMPEEAAPLAGGLKPDNSQLSTLHSQLLLQRILYWTNGHPYLTQRLCQALAVRDSPAPPEGRVPRGPDQERAEKSAAGEDQGPVKEDQGLAELVLPSKVVDQLCDQLFLSPRAREQDDNLLFVRERIVRTGGDLPALLHLYETIHRGRRLADDETSPLVANLRLAGIVRAAQGSLLVRNRIYENVFNRPWIRASMPDAEVRRQKTAYRRGVMRASALTSAIIISLAAAFLYARHQAHVAEARFYAADMNLAAQALRDGSLGAAKAILDRHRQEANLMGFEWRYLWQRCRGDFDVSLPGHASLVCKVAFSPDGKLLASHDVGNVLKVWDLTTSQVRFSLSNVTALTGFTPDSAKLLVGLDTNAVAACDVANGQITRQVEGSGELFALLADGHTVATTSTNFLVRLFDWRSGQETLRLPGEGGSDGGLPSLVSISDDGRYLASLEDGTKLTNRVGLAVWDLAARTRLARHEKYLTNTAKFAPIGRIDMMRMLPDASAVVWGGTDGFLRFWRWTNFVEEPAVIPAHRAALSDAVFSSDGRSFATASSDQTIKLWDRATLGELAWLQGHEDRVQSLAISFNGRWLASGGVDRTVKLWDLDRRRSTASISGLATFGFNTYSFRFSPNGRILAVSMDNGATKLLDAESLREIASLTNAPFMIGFARAGQTLLTITPANEASLAIWNVGARTVERQVRLPFSVTWDGTTAELSPDGRLVAISTEDSRVHLYQLDSGRELTNSLACSEPVIRLAFSPDGRTLVSMGEKILHFWDVHQARLVRSIQAHSPKSLALDFSPDGKIVATAGRGQIRLWDAGTGVKLDEFAGHRQGIYGLSFSPDGKTLASCSSDRTIKLWSLAIRQEVCTIPFSERLAAEEDQRVMEIRFAPDGNSLWAMSGGGELKVWRAPSWAETRTVEQFKIIK